MIKRLFTALLAALAITLLAPNAHAQSSWSGVDRIVVIGDLEGDYPKFVDMLETAGLIDQRQTWIGGRAHLVQLGDIPDRGAESRRIMDLLMRLEDQAERAGGRVHALIGNHEAMNVEGDLRYVHPGEYAAFVDRNSGRRRAEYYRRTIDYLRANPPETGVPAFDDAFRTAWEAQHPLGYVEHRLAWAPSGEYGRWVAAHNAAIRINDTLFLHGGIGPAYNSFDLETLNRAVRDALEGRPHEGLLGEILTHEQGPLWYRGFAMNDEAAELAQLEAVLARHGVTRVVIGHTKLAPAVFPRFNGRVIITDIAVHEGTADPHAFLIIDGGLLTTVHRGQRIPLIASNLEETCAYLAAVAALDPPDSRLARLSAQCGQPAPMDAPPPE